jgi:hydroxymethylpyrimidine/phosphomethylpyrimidine kinase
MSVAPEQQRPSLRPVSVLTIAGSDSGGGAGIQADLKTFAAHRVHGVSAVAALTAQNTRAVTAVHLPPEAFLRQQLDALADDFALGAVKIGMLASAGVIETVAAWLRERPALPVVLDPVMIASSGAALLQPDALLALRERLLPLATVLTPNLPEAEALLGRRIEAAAGMEGAAHELRQLTRGAVLLKGGHLPGQRLVDVYFDGTALLHIEHPRLPLEGHGTGCTLAAAVAARLARGAAPVDASRAACDYVHGALRHAYRPGLGTVAVLDHFWETAPLEGRG